MLRPREMDHLRRLILTPGDGSPVALVAALRGAGGYGKTTLAQALCREAEVRAEFDEVLWLTLGENPPERIGLVEDLVHHLEGERPGFASLDAAASRLAAALEDRRLLLVLDDVWSPAHLRPFLRGGPRCVRLVTTRDRTVLPRSSRTLDVDAMSEEQAVDLLSRGLSTEGNRPALERLAERLGRWPLLLGLVNGVLWDRSQQVGQPLPRALVSVHRELADRGLTAFDLRDPNDRHRAVATTLEVSLDRLDDEERERYQELAIFPEDVAIPHRTLAVLWGDDEGAVTQARCLRLHQMSLLAKMDLRHETVQLHDVVRGYLVDRAGERLPELHRRLLQRTASRLRGAWRPDQTWPWRRMSPEEPYLWERLAYHLAAAGCGEALYRTLSDLDFVATRIGRGQTRGMDNDLESACCRLPDARPLHELHALLSRLQNLFIRCNNTGDGRANLAARLEHHRGLTDLAKSLNIPKGSVLLRPRFPLPDTPPPSLVRTLPGHELEVNACALSADGSRLVSVSEDGTLRVWDTHGGESLLLRELGAEGVACQITDDGQTVLGATAGALEIWHVDSGVLLLHRSIEGEDLQDASMDGVGQLCSFATGSGRVGVIRIPDGEDLWARQLHLGTTARGSSRMDRPGKVLLVTAADGLRLLDPDTGEDLGILPVRTTPGEGKLLAACDLTRDGSHACATEDGTTTTIWDLETRTVRSRIRHDVLAPTSCSAFIPGSGEILLPDVRDQPGLAIWNWRNGKRIRHLQGSSSFVSACAASASRVVSADHLFQLRVWDPGRAEEAGVVAGHSGIFYACAVGPGKDRVVTAQEEGRVRTWNTRTGELEGEWTTGEPHSLLDLTVIGEHVVTASLRTGVHLWEGTSGKHLTRLAASPRGHRCALAATPGLLAAAIGGRLRVWEVPSLTPLFDLATDLEQANGCALSSDGRWAVVSGDEPYVVLFNLERPASEPRRLRGHEGRIGQCCFTEEGSRLISPSEDETIRIWDLEKDTAPRVLRGHGSPVWSCAARGRYLLSICRAFYADSIRLWDLETLRCRLILWNTLEPETCAWLPDGDTVFVGGLHGMSVLDLEELAED